MEYKDTNEKSVVQILLKGIKGKKYQLIDRLKVLKLYLENCGIRTIERLAGVRNSQVSKWIEEAAEDIKTELKKSQNNINSIQDIEILEIDELCIVVFTSDKLKIYSDL